MSTSKCLNYLKDKESEAVFVKEVYDRSKSDLKIRHILITLPACPTPADTLAAWNTITKIKKDIAKSKNFEDAAKKLSQDTTSAKNGGLLGYYTVMSLYYPFETMAYNLKAGEVSNPVRSSQGYHLIKIDEIRPARGKVKVAHIFVRTAEKDDAGNARIFQAQRKRIFQRSFFCSPGQQPFFQPGYYNKQWPEPPHSLLYQRIQAQQ